MTRKTKPIIRGNIVVWPLIPRLTRGVNLARQRSAARTSSKNVVVLPVVQIERHSTRRANCKPMDIGVVRATMHNQRYDARYEQAQEALRKIFNNPA